MKPLNETIVLFAAVLLVATAALAGEVWPPYQPIQRQGMVIDTIKHQIVVAPTGLPEQLFIKPLPAELPLEMRGKNTPLDDQALVALGRGPQLRSPMRLTATILGKQVDAEVTAAAQLVEQTPAHITYRSAAVCGPVKADLTVTYYCDGAMVFNISSKTEEKTDALELVLDIRGPVTHAYRGLPSNFRPDAVGRDALDTLVPADTDAIVWSNLDEWAGKAQPNLTYLYVGSLDRGFTLLADQWFIIDKQSPTATISRDRAGNASLHLYLLNSPTDEAEVQHTFALIIHPAKPRPKDYRTAQWLGQTQGAELISDGVEHTTLKAFLAARTKAKTGTVGGLSGGAFESMASEVELTGFAGAFSISPEQDNVRLYPNSLFAVMAGPYRGLPTRVQTNMRGLATAGEALSYDRQIIGRALVHDIGAAIQGFKQPLQHLQVVRALEEFGYFDDTEIEVLPYWRNGSILRYGEKYEEDDPFALTEENPAAGVYVTAYRKPFEKDGKRGYAAMIAVMNENDHPVRERLYILDTEKLLGGLCRLTAFDLFETYPFQAVPKESDWRPDRVKGIYAGHNSRRSGLDSTFKWLEGGAGKPPVLRDMEDNSFVEHFPLRYAPPPEVYGPLYIPARDFRLLYGYWVKQ